MSGNLIKLKSAKNRPAESEKHNIYLVWPNGHHDKILLACMQKWRRDILQYIYIKDDYHDLTYISDIGVLHMDSNSFIEK